MKILNRPTPWKRWITKLQIIQFATSFALLGKTLWHYQRSNNCAGMKALVYNCIFNATLIVQFIGVDKRNKAQKKEWNHLSWNFSKKTHFQLGIFVSTAHFFARQNLPLPSQLGLLRSIHFFFLLRFPRLQETEKKKTRNRILDLNHKKRGAASGSSVGWKIRRFFWWWVFGCFWLGAGRPRGEVVFQDDMVIPGWQQQCEWELGASASKPKVAGPGRFVSPTWSW